MNRPDFLYFDLGRVLVNFDHERAVQQLAEIANCEEDRVRNLVFESNLQSEYERGQISTGHFCDRFRIETHSEVSDEKICRAASDIFWSNDSMVPVVTGLKSVGVPIGILSNTCAAHWQFILDKAFPIMESFEPRSDVTVLSYEVGAAKPEPAIYQFAIEKSEVDPSQIFFVDDLPANVAGARKAGMDAVLYTTTDQLIEDLTARHVISRS